MTSIIQPTKMMYIWIIFIMNFTQSNFQIFKLISESILSIPLFQNRVWKYGMIDLDSRSTQTTTDSGSWLKSSKGSGVKICSRSWPNQEVETLVHINFPTMENDFLRLVIQVQEWQVWESKLTLKYYSNRVAK